MRFIIINIIFLFTVHFCLSQENLLQNQYLLNINNSNPAELVENNTLIVNFSDRHQWIGFENSPYSQVFGVNSNHKNLGASIILMNDINGIYNNKSVQLYLGYKININKKKNIALSFGTSTQVNQISKDLRNISALVENDPLIDYQIEKKYFPDAGFGMRLNYKQLKISMAANNLMQTSVLDYINFFEKTYYTPNYIVYSEYIFKKSKNLMILPSIMIKFFDVQNYKIDLNSKIILNKQYIMALSLRKYLNPEFFTDGTIKSIFAYSYNQITAIYSFEYFFSNLNINKFCTHEIMFKYKIKYRTKNRNDICPAYN